MLYLDSLVWFSINEFDPSWVSELKDRLTVFVREYNIKNTSEVKGRLVKNYQLRDGMMGVPVALGLQLFQDEVIQFNLSDGHPIECPKRPDPNHPCASPGQAEAMKDCVSSSNSSPVILIKAPTGWGKTVVALNTIAELGKTALVVVDRKTLSKQWREEISSILGLSNDKIGIVEDGEVDYEDKSIVVAVIQNLVNKTWEKDFYNYFGTVVWDEAHKLGAEKFCKTMTMFPARHKIAMTATPTRKDGATSIFLDYFGEPSVEGSADALMAECYVYKRNLNIKNAGKYTKPKLISILASNEKRNTEIASIIHRLVLENRKGIIVLSDRIEQLQTLMSICYDLGISDESMGLFTRSFVNNQGKKLESTEEELDHAKRALIIFATYSMAKEAFNVPRLDAGVDATPQSDLIQAIGRIRRPLPDKTVPKWVTLCDLGVDSIEKMSRSRLSGLRKNNVVIKEYE